MKESIIINTDIKYMKAVIFQKFKLLISPFAIEKTICIIEYISKPINIL